MKSLMIILSTLLFASFANAEVTNNGYTCRETAKGVCATKADSYQCTHQWNEDDSNNPMFHCMKFIGIKVSNYNKANYYCRDKGGYVCAASKASGQCTNSWDKDNHNDAMWSCKKFLGQVKSSFDKSKFVCAKTVAGNVCAKSGVSGQCTHVWKKSQDADPMWSCKNWLKT